MCARVGGTVMDPTPTSHCPSLQEKEEIGIHDILPFKSHELCGRRLAGPHSCGAEAEEVTGHAKDAVLCFLGETGRTSVVFCVAGLLRQMLNRALRTVTLFLAVHQWL